MKPSLKYVILRDRLDLYKDFTFNLLYYIYEYRLDQESLNQKSLDKEDIIYNHFNWCYNEVCKQFLEEEIDFTDNAELKSYFFGYYYNQMYCAKEIKSLSYFKKFWNEIFNFENQGNKNLLKIFIEMYLIYNTTINKKNEK